MRIQHNIMAMSAYRNYTNNVSAMKKNLEKLSSGYKINRAGDDAAGLAISEKMRAQITGLEVAQKNSKDGISLVQTAEGALTEVHDMLNRMYELAGQSANGTYDSTVDRAQLQKELESLRTEIDRIADSSNFNGIKLLDGSMGSGVGKAQAVTVTAVNDGVQGGNDAQAGVYSFDLKDLKVYAATGNQIAGGTVKVGNFTLQYGTFTSGAVGDDGFVTGEELVASLKANTNTTEQVLVNGQVGSKAQVTFDGSKVTFTMLAAPTTADAIPSNLTVALTGGALNNNNNSWDQAVHAEKPAMVANPNKVAQGSFQLTDDMVKDGAQLTIGDTVYTFKVGKDSTTTGSNLIDLSSYAETDADRIKAAADKLSQIDNSLFDVTTNSSGDTIYMTERVGKVDYNKDWDLQGTTTAADGKWNEAVKDGNRKGGVVSFAPKAEGGGTLKLQIGEDAKSYNQLSVSISDAHAAAMGIGSISIGSQTDAQAAMASIKDAINYVSDIRGTLGATQNRLEHTINNLSVMQENIQDAESTIRDTDVAAEMMAYTKNNILIQSAQAMLAQANQVPQGVLQLLQ